MAVKKLKQKVRAAPQPVKRAKVSSRRTASKKPKKLSKPKIIIKDRIYIPAFMVGEDDLDEHYKYEFEVQSNGREHTVETEVVRLWTEEEIKGRLYYAIPAGNMPKVQKRLGIDLSQAVDRRSDVKLDWDWQWTGSLYTGKIVKGNRTTNQKKLVKKWLAKKYGVIEALPRSGKTVMSSYIATQLKRRTIILANQEDLLRNFEKDIRAYTNIDYCEQIEGRKLIGIVKTMKDFNKYDICLVTYQKFIRASGDERMRQFVLGKFGFSIIDEAHGVGATGFARIANRIDTRYRLGITATPARKDGRYEIVKDIIGPVTARSKSVSLVPHIDIVETGVSPKRGYKHWAYAMKFLAEHEDRNKLIVKNIFKDLRAGHKCIIVPVDRTDHMNALVKRINQQAKINRVKRGEPESMWPKETAIGFWSKSPRKEILEKIDNEQVRVVVAIRSLIKQGVNVLIPSMMHIVVPVSAGKDQATGSPLFQQLSNRVCTPYLNKPQPIVKLYIDAMDQSVGCFRSLFSKEILPRLKDKKGNPARYKIDTGTYNRAMNIIKDGTRGYKFVAKTAKKEQKEITKVGLKW